MNHLISKYALYLLRWQLSTPILAVVVGTLAVYGEWVAAMAANLIGGLVFFWVDRWIFRPGKGGKGMKTCENCRHKKLCGGEIRCIYTGRVMRPDEPGCYFWEGAAL